MHIDVITLFPGMFKGFLKESMIAKAIKLEALKVKLINFRKYSGNKHNQVDDYPYGGGAGMVLKPEPVYKAVKLAKKKTDAPVIYFTPQGRILTQSILKEYSQSEKLILICGHYKELDQRVRDLIVTDEISVGDYVLSGGELPAMIFIDGVSRLLPGVLSDMESAETDSFSDGLLGYPCYTRPPEFMGLQVPEVLLNGNHKLIEKWRKEQSLILTVKRRPDLIKK
ncbi:MAG: tRNA (guanosine(37)-N1)-methyltransferase TrmD [Candidatus Cloacimonetes bacterium]|nr:tRNA (guanosine(37)-N1)-methyltransferase TrmD [Candidatus Cloacimonadota bacterium]